MKLQKLFNLNTKATGTYEGMPVFLRADYDLGLYAPVEHNFIDNKAKIRGKARILRS